MVEDEGAEEGMCDVGGRADPRSIAGVGGVTVRMAVAR